MTNSRIVVYFDMEQDATTVVSKLSGVYSILTTPTSFTGKYDILYPDNGLFSNCGFELGNFTGWTTRVFPDKGSDATVESVSGGYQSQVGYLFAIYDAESVDGDINADLTLSSGDQLKFKYKIVSSDGTSNFKAYLSEPNYPFYPLVVATSPTTGDWIEIRVNEESLPATFNRTCKLYFYVSAG